MYMYHLIQGGVEILLDASYYTAYDKNILEFTTITTKEFEA